jgi:hypothetical protein
MNGLTQVIILAVMVEAIWENIKRAYTDSLQVSVIGSLVISIVVCVLTGVDVFEIIGLPIKVAFVGSIFTGVIAARGANFVNDLFTRLNGPKKEA